MPEASKERVYGPQYKLIGKNYVTADLLARLSHLGAFSTGKLFVFSGAPV
jgi:hypothetical protein